MTKEIMLSITAACLFFIALLEIYALFYRAEVKKAEHQLDMTVSSPIKALMAVTIIMPIIAFLLISFFLFIYFF